jgi:hypothetical protein
VGGDDVPCHQQRVRFGSGPGRATKAVQEPERSAHRQERRGEGTLTAGDGDGGGDGGGHLDVEQLAAAL